MMQWIKNVLMGAAAWGSVSVLTALSASAQEILVATVNNNDMVIMQKLSPEFEKETGIKVRWVVLEENSLREKLATDISMKAAQYDVITINSHQTQLWGKMGWLMPLDDLGEDYDYEDIISSISMNSAVDGVMYGAPFYGEGLMTYYRKDLFEKAGLTMPDKPTFDDIALFAEKLHDPENGVYGICLRGKPGWGENSFLLSTFVNAFGGAWFDMKWEPLLTSQPWHDMLNWYLDVMNKYGPPGASSNGYNENRVLFSTGKCGLWIDATVTAGYLLDPKESLVADKTDFAPYPITAINPDAAGTSGSWGLGIPVNSTENAQYAKQFIKWATSKSYVKLVGEREGWLLAPPGTRTSTYQLPQYRAVAEPFADRVLHAIAAVNPNKPSIHEVPYIGSSSIHIPEYQAIGTTLGQNLAAALVGSKTPEQALQETQDFVKRTMQRAGYYR